MDKSKITRPWADKTEDLLEMVDVDPDKGLEEEEVKRRQEKFGKNQLQSVKEKSVFQIAVDQFKSLIVLLLVISAVLSFFFGDYVEGVAIVVVILINAAIGFFTELRAVRSMEALKELTRVTAKVRRDGTISEIDATEIVPGDILILNAGDVVTADVRLINASKLQINESALTGESYPVDKQIKPLDEDTVLADRTNMAFKGTAVARGSGEAVVVNAGMQTELGNISSLVQEADDQVTPLQKRLDSLGRKLIWVTLILVAIVAFAGWVSGRDLRLMIETAIALAVASIPEGLPIVATIALARGMERMARKNALINKLSSVETLGATSVIITDKTGTLTENQMTVTEISIGGNTITVEGEGLDVNGEFSWQEKPQNEEIKDAFDALIKVGVLCNDASLSFEDQQVVEAVGEPMEIALKVVGHKAGLPTEELISELPEVKKFAFESDTKMMTTIHQLDDGEYLFAVKGSPEAVLGASTKIFLKDGVKEISETQKDEWEEKNISIANRGLRVIALAQKTADNKDEDPYENLTFLGLAALLDPPREEIRFAIDRCKEAGIRVIMATGDHGETAYEIGKAVNLVESDEASYVLGEDLKDLDNLSDEKRNQYLKTQIFARVDPEQKLELIRQHQENGEIVAMTGDGVNDAPALKKADIGIAMGERGTQVAKETADMVLEDDNFGTIVNAVEQGRTIFANIRKFVLYLLSCNISEIMVVTLASVINLPLPILPLQILFLNLVTDVFPALALGVGEGDPQMMKVPPRKSDEPIMTRRHWLTTGIFGVLITSAVVIGLNYALKVLGFEQSKATTISFLILAFAQLWHVFDMRENGTSIIRNSVTKNKYIWFALLLTISLLLMAVYVPFFANLMSLQNPGMNGWLLVILASVTPMLIGQILKEFKLVI